jgi:hypothetical protein
MRYKKLIIALAVAAALVAGAAYALASLPEILPSHVPPPH